jgi:hypothetical protein
MMSEQAESQELKTAAAYVLSQTSLAQRVPQEVRREIDEILRKPSSQRRNVEMVWQDLQIKERFGVSRRDFRAYARQLWVTDHPELCGPAVLGLAALLSIPVGPGGALGRKAQTLAQARLAEVLCREDLAPEQLAKLLEATVKGQAVTLKGTAQKFAEKASMRAEEAAERRAKTKGDGLTLEERVRRIYGFDAPKAKEGDASP